MILYKIFLKKLLNPLENSILTKKQDTSSDLKREKTKEQDEKSFMKLLLLQQMLSNPQKIKIDFDLPEVGTVYDKPKILKDTEKKEYFEKMKNFTIIGSDGINDENRIINDLKNKKQNIVQILNKIKKIFSEFNDLNTIHKNFLENDKNNINNMNFINNKLNELIKNLEQRLEEVDKNLKDLDLQKKNNLYKII